MHCILLGNTNCTYFLGFNYYVVCFPIGLYPPIKQTKFTHAYRKNYSHIRISAHTRTVVSVTDVYYVLLQNIWQLLSSTCYFALSLTITFSIQGLVAAHWPPVALPTLPYAGIPTRLFGLRTILRTEGFCNPSIFCVLSVRRQWQEVRWDM